jgi:SAM-dependent methyltransferase
MVMDRRETTYMSANGLAAIGQYALGTGANAVGRLDLLHSIYSHMGRQVLTEAGLTEGMHVADFGCGTGTMTRTLASIVGPSGSVTGIDLHGAQLEQAGALCAQEGLSNTRFIEADATRTGLPRNTFDAAYCRFLLLHLPDPAACLKEMWAILRPGGLVVVEDGDLASAGSIPQTALDAFADLFGRLAPIRGVNYSVANVLPALVADAGFSELGLKVHQPAERAGASGILLKWSVEEAGPAFVDAGLVTQSQLAGRLAEMQDAATDSNVLALAPRMSLVWARKRVV